MHPLLARGLETGIHADGLTDDAGARVRVQLRDGWLRCEVSGADDAPLGTAWRWPPQDRRPDAWDGLPDVPFLPGLSGVAVRDRSGLTVTWPAPPPSTGLPGGVGRAAGMVGLPPSAAPDPVADAWSRYTAEGRAGDALPGLRDGLERLLRLSDEDGWSVGHDERLEGPVEARVVRMRRTGAERSVTLSRALGVSTLVMIEKAGRGR